MKTVKITVEDVGEAKIVGPDLRLMDAPRPVPRQIRKLVRAGRYAYDSDLDRLITALACMWPEGRVPSAGLLEELALVAMTIAADDAEATRRAAHAASRLAEGGYVIRPKMLGDYEARVHDQCTIEPGETKDTLAIGRRIRARLNPESIVEEIIRRLGARNVKR